ncbi:hypothetical protein WDU94_004667 [Cyamophila willieti]
MYFTTLVVSDWEPLDPRNTKSKLNFGQFLDKDLCATKDCTTGFKDLVQSTSAGKLVRATCMMVADLNHDVCSVEQESFHMQVWLENGKSKARVQHISPPNVSQIRALSRLFTIFSCTLCPFS